MAYEEASLDDLTTILHNTVIRYRKKPVFVKEVDGRELWLTSLENPKEKANPVSLSDLEIDFTPVPLGFVNFNKYAYYITRVPSRQYKQGLSTGNIAIEAVEENHDTIFGIQTLQNVCNKSLAACILGRYPCLEQAIKDVVEGAKSVAFSRQFAIDEHFDLLFKTERVGSVNGETGEVWFKRTKQHIKDVFYARHCGS